MAKNTHADDVKNMEYFEKKFAMQSSQTVGAAEDIIVRESDRVIATITTGPQDRILDKDMYTIWKDMRWPGYSKANHFILALRDFYQQKVEMRKLATKKGEDPGPDPDGWAYSHINVPYIQHLIEAIDDDASGFITLPELNKFTSSRPKDWSLPHWLAYWAVGWYQTMAEEKEKILSIFDKMHGILPRLLPENRPLAIQYLEVVWPKVTQYVYSLNRIHAPSIAGGRFRSFVASEEERLRTGLEDINYNIKDMDSCYLITGPGSIEKHFFPLIRLLLERHFEIFRICKTKVIHDNELSDAADAVEWVYDAVWYRHENLKATFTRQRRDLEKEFGAYSFGLYECVNKPSILWATRFKNMKFKDDVDDSLEYETYAEEERSALEDDSSQEKKSQEPQDILHYPEIVIDYPSDGEPDDCIGYDGEARLANKDVISGDWNILLYESKDAVDIYCPMISFHADVPTEEQPRQFRMSGFSYSRAAFTCTGAYSETEDKAIFDVQFRYWVNDWPDDIRYLAGKLDVLAGSVSGTWGDEEDAAKHKGVFELKRTPGQLLRFRPAPVDFSKNKSKALWDYAASCAVHLVRKRRWSWAFFKERRDTRRGYIDLAMRDDGFGRPCSPEEKKELIRLRQLLSAPDARFYHLLRVLRERPLMTDEGYSCDACDDYIDIRYPGRVMCLDCELKRGATSSEDFCLKMECINKTMKDEKRLESPHLPSHRVLLIRRDQLLRYKLKEMNAAKHAVTKGERIFDALVNGEYSAGEDYGSLNVTNDSSSEADSNDNSDASDDESGDADADEGQQDLASNHGPREVAAISEDGAGNLRPYDNDPEDEPGLNCGVCNEALQRPCWYCIDCIRVNIFFCINCTEKGGTALEKFGHDQFHSLVLIRDRKGDETENKTLEFRVEGLQGRIDSIGTNVQELKDSQSRVEGLFHDVKERQCRVEKQIQTLLDRQMRIEEMLTKLSVALDK